MSSIDDPGSDPIADPANPPSSSHRRLRHDDPLLSVDMPSPGMQGRGGLPQDRYLADPSQAPPRYASPRVPATVRSSYATYFDTAQLGRDIVSVALKRAPEGGPPFILRSGHASDWYLDKYAIATRPYLLDRVAFLLGHTILHELPGNPSAHPARRPTRLAGIELGSVPLTIATSLEIGMPSIIIRKDAKVYGPNAVRDPIGDEGYDRVIAKAMIEGDLDPIDIVVLIEDIVTTGFELVRGTHILRNFGISPDSIYAVAVIDREEGAAKAFADEGIPFVPLFTKTSLMI